ncbi:MAG TPA: 3-dehydroquinate synthase [Burkholderiaceae bacterium]|nr:3-dehydroquinate synthase [Burkholderiaceae bacterium]
MKPQTTTVGVSTPGGDYDIHIGPGRLDRLDASVPDDASAIALVTTTAIGPLYGTRAREALERSGKRVIYVELPDGEAHKNWETLNRIFDVLLQNRLDRKALLVALGGGVVGDMVGFAAATYMRGVRFLQVPTTLLAQVDSSVGGKTAINHPLGKNMIGAFHQPTGVEIDTDVLATLPAREISAGLAEVIKYGMIIDPEFFSWCEANIAAMRKLEPHAITHAIKRSCEIKAHVVSRDERESGLRAILNFGHTFGHAIEAGLGYGQWLHGEAVGCGMIQAAELSHRVLGLPEDSVRRIASLVQASGCPDTPPAMDASRWLELMQVDKKAQDGNIRFVLLDRIGSARVQTVPADALDAVLASAGGGTR